MKLKTLSETDSIMSKTICRTVLATTALATVLSLIPSTGRAADAPPSNVNELVSLEFASEYVTPRGMLVHDTGLTFEPLALTIVNLYKSDSFLSSLSFAGGAWADFTSAGESEHAPYGSAPKTDFTEVDPIASLSFGLAKDFKLDLTYSAFAEQILSIPVSQNFEAKLTYDDSKYLGAYALHPFFSYWQEVSGKATDADVPEAVLGPSHFSGSHPAPGPSYYFDTGIDPSYTFKNGWKIEAPCSVLLPNERFYGDYYAASSTVGLWEVSLRGTIPLKFMPAGYGHWNFNYGANFLYFVDDNLVNLNTFNAPQKPVRDTVQGFAGVTLFF
jgi:hypothetical protein